jgi:hypothetical protein
MSFSVPHLAFPLSFQTAPDGTIGAAVNEQDSLDDIMACALAIAACPLGAWVDQPQFGVSSGLFSQAPVDAIGVANAIDEWEPRAQSSGVEYADLLDPSVRHVQVTVAPGQADQ